MVFPHIAIFEYSLIFGGSYLVTPSGGLASFSTQ
jgi:hypothetical protein